MSISKHIDRRYIEKIFPELKKIKDRGLRAHVVDVWVLAVKQGKWKQIEHIPFTLLIDTSKTLIQHTRIVTRMAMAIGAERGDINMDILIAGGICHDVGKLLEYTQKGTKISKSPLGRRVRHPVSGYGLAIQAGLPVQVAHIIYAHSVEGEKVIRSKEAIIVNHCDFIDFDIEKTV